MFWIRVFLLAVMLLYLVYYCMIVLQLNEVIKFTNLKDKKVLSGYVIRNICLSIT